MVRQTDKTTDKSRVSVEKTKMFMWEKRALNHMFAKFKKENTQQILLRGPREVRKRGLFCPSNKNVVAVLSRRERRGRVG